MVKNVNMLNKHKNFVIGSMMFVMLLAIMIPMTQATSTPTERQLEQQAESITMDQLLELTGSSLAEPTEELSGIMVTTYADFGLTREQAMAASICDDYTNDIVVEYPEQTRNHYPVSIIVCLDEEFFGAYSSNATAEYAAKNIIAGAFTRFNAVYEIGYEINRYVYWNTPNSHSYGELVTTLSGVDPTGVGADIIILVSGQWDPKALGCAYIPTSRHCIVNGLASTPGGNILVQHEVSHLYGCKECSRACIMNTHNVTNSWCNPLLSRGCHNIMDDNKHKFD
jgi:hypothetical protein